MDTISFNLEYIFMEDDCFSGLRISFLFFVDDVVLLVSSNNDLQLAPGHFVSGCEATVMKTSTSKAEATVLSRKKVTLTPGQEHLTANAV